MAKSGGAWMRQCLVEGVPAPNVIESLYPQGHNGALIPKEAGVVRLDITPCGVDACNRPALSRTGPRPTDQRSAEAPAGPGRFLPYSTKPLARCHQIDATLGQDLRNIAGGEHGDQCAREHVAEVVCADDDPACRHDRPRQDI